MSGTASPEDANIGSDHEPMDFTVPDAQDLHEDDPQVDWRTQDQENVLSDTSDIEDDASVSTDDENPEGFLAFDYEIPQALKYVEVRSESSPLGPRGDQKVHAGYQKFLSFICSATKTAHADNPGQAGLPYAVSKAQCLTLERIHEADHDLDIYAYALIIHLWQIVCLRIQYDQYTEGSSLSSRMASYFLATHALINTKREVSWEVLKFATQYWERRLFEKGQGDAWLKEGTWFPNIPILQEQPLTKDPIAEYYMKVLEDEGKLGLAFAIMEKEGQGPKTPLRDMMQDPNRRFEQHREIVGILAATDIDLLKAIIQGQVSRKAEIAEQPVWAALKFINDPGVVQPSIYMNSICDALGMSPTPEQWDEVCDYMHMYAQRGQENNAMACDIDQLIHPSSRWPKEKTERGLRRYTDWRPSNRSDSLDPCLERRQMVKHFVGEMKTRIKEERELGRMHAPLSTAVKEIGFSINSHHRLSEHRHRQNSNYLMNLAQAAFQYVFPGMFKLQQRIIYACYRETQIWLGEIILTQIAQGYTKGAKGFSHYAAGYSNGSAYAKTPTESWVRFQSEAFHRGHLDNELTAMELKSEGSLRHAKAERELKDRAFELEQARLQALSALIESMTKLRQAQIEGKSEQDQRGSG